MVGMAWHSAWKSTTTAQLTRTAKGMSTSTSCARCRRSLSCSRKGVRSPARSTAQGGRCVAAASSRSSNSMASGASSASQRSPAAPFSSLSTKALAFNAKLEARVSAMVLIAWPLESMGQMRCTPSCTKERSSESYSCKLGTAPGEGGPLNSSSFSLSLFSSWCSKARRFSTSSRLRGEMPPSPPSAAAAAASIAGAGPPSSGSNAAGRRCCRSSQTAAAAAAPPTQPRMTHSAGWCHAPRALAATAARAGCKRAPATALCSNTCGAIAGGP
mmetsp:Transcript_85162/g.235937  ORF Transcript_85162/g.235937 Transcript_85162/m.235937 type:complete len:272 (+) Transcript_85162:176-991(+)